MRIPNPFRKWWQFWKPKYIDLTLVTNKPLFRPGVKIIHEGKTYVYFKRT